MYFSPPQAPETRALQNARAILREAIETHIRVPNDKNAEACRVAQADYRREVEVAEKTRIEFSKALDLALKAPPPAPELEPKPVRSGAALAWVVYALFGAAAVIAGRAVCFLMGWL